jgi:hypothetical protein
MTISQRAYIERLTATVSDDLAGIERRKPTSPMLTEPKQITTEHHATKQAVRKYQSGVGSMIYAMNVTRPDLAYHLSVISQFLLNPDDDHYAVMQRINNYLHHSKDLQLTFRAPQASSNNPPSISSDTSISDGIIRGYVDASYNHSDLLEGSAINEVRFAEGLAVM